MRSITSSRDLLLHYNEHSDSFSLPFALAPLLSSLFLALDLFGDDVKFCRVMSAPGRKAGLYSGSELRAKAGHNELSQWK